MSDAVNGNGCITFYMDSSVYNVLGYQELFSKLTRSDMP